MKDEKIDSQIFITYKGHEILPDRIIEVLGGKYHCNCIVKPIFEDNIVFAKKSYDKKNPSWNEYCQNLTVGSYDQDEMEEASKHYYEYPMFIPFEIPNILNYFYSDYEEYMFLHLSQYMMNFCIAVWDSVKNSFIAGVRRIPKIVGIDNEYAHLYYGYVGENNELMFSNNKNILQQFCKSIYEMEAGTYVKDGEIYTIDGEKVKEMIKK